VIAAGEAGNGIAGLIVESGFANTFDLLDRLGVCVPAAFRHQDPFNNLGKIGRLRTPVLVLHGEEDDLIPVAAAQALYGHSAAPDKRLVTIPGAGHNDLMLVGMTQYFEAIRGFVSTSAVEDL